MDPEDYLKKASGVFKGLGHRLRTTVGVRVGKVILDVENTNLAPGDTLRATVKLELPEVTHAKRLVLAIRATQTVAKVGGREQPVVQTGSVVVWKHNVELAGNRDYEDGESFSGEIVIPADVLDMQPPMPDGPLGQVVSAVNAVRSATKLPLRWRAMALLDIPWKRNIKKVIDVTVSKR